MEKLTYGEYIKRRRVELGLSQTDLAKVLSCSYQAISKYENDLVNIDLSFINKLAKALKVDVESFLLKKYEKNNDFTENYTFDSERLAKSIIFLREKKMISQKDLAKEIGISATRLSKIEQCNSNLKIEEFLKIAEFFNVNITSFYYTIDEKELFNKNDNKENEEEK